MLVGLAKPNCIQQQVALTSTERKGSRGDRVFFMCACREADPAAARAAAEEEAAVAGQHH